VTGLNSGWWARVCRTERPVRVGDCPLLAPRIAQTGYPLDASAPYM